MIYVTYNVVFKETQCIFFVTVETVFFCKYMFGNNLILMTKILFKSHDSFTTKKITKHHHFQDQEVPFLCDVDVNTVVGRDLL